MTKQQWVTVALTNDAMVAELLIRLKQPSSLHSSRCAPATSSSTAFFTPITWGHRKSRSKPSPITTTNTTAVASNAFRKEQQSGSPTTPLCWSGGGGSGSSTSDGYDESSRPSDLSAGGRSNKAREKRRLDHSASRFEVPCLFRNL